MSSLSDDRRHSNTTVTSITTTIVMTMSFTGPKFDKRIDLKKFARVGLQMRTKCW